jgi:hypothetical protein
VIHSEEHAFIFFELGRTGTTSVQEVLRERGRAVAAWDPELRDRFAALVKRGIRRRGKRYRASVRTINKHIAPWMATEVLAASELRRCFKFAFVRNPFDKAVSLYRYHTGTGEVEASDFKAYLERFRERYMDAEPQVEWLSDDGGRMLVDYVGRFETLQADFDGICARIGLPRATLPHRNRSERVDFRDYYDGESRRWVAEVFRPDLEAFGYGFDD